MLKITTKIPFDFQRKFVLNVGENFVPKSKINAAAGKHLAHLAEHGILTIESADGAAIEPGELPEMFQGEPPPGPCADCVALNDGGAVVVPCKACFVNTGHDAAMHAHLVAQIYPGKAEAKPSVDAERVEAKPVGNTCPACLAISADGMAQCKDCYTKAGYAEETYEGFVSGRLASLKGGADLDEESTGDEIPPPPPAASTTADTEVEPVHEELAKELPFEPGEETPATTADETPEAKKGSSRRSGRR